MKRLDKLVNEAEVVFEQNEEFEFTLKKNRFGQSGNKLSATMVDSMFKARTQKVGIIDHRGKVLSQNF